MMFCLHCGKPLEDESIFCGNCGNKVDIVDTSDNTSLVSTAYEDIQPQPTPIIPPAATAPAKKSPRVGVIICAALLAIVLGLGLGVGGIFVFRSFMIEDTPPHNRAELRELERQAVVEEIEDNRYTHILEDTAAEAPQAPDTPPPAVAEPPIEEPAPLPEPPVEEAPEETPAELPEPEPNPPLHPFPGSALGVGSENAAAVMILQNTLNHVSRYYTNIRYQESVDGFFGGATQGAVIDFQHRIGMRPTGIVDERTWYAIMDVQANPPAVPDLPFVPTLNANYITLVNLHLRERPTTDSESLGIVSEGTWVFVLDATIDRAWFHVRSYDGQYGFMNAQFLLQEGIMH